MRTYLYEYSPHDSDNLFFSIVSNNRNNFKWIVSKSYMYHDYYTIEYASITIIIVNKLRSIQNLVLIQFNIAICKTAFLIHIITYYILLNEIINFFILNRTIDLNSNVVYKL